jgi:hypothetical protein
MPQIDLKKVNAGLAEKGRTNQNVGPIPKEIRELAKSKARLEARVSPLEREVRKQLGARPAAPAKASTASAAQQQAPAKLGTSKSAAKKRIIYPCGEEQARIDKLCVEREQKKTLVSS